MTFSWKILGYAAGMALVGTVGACTVTTNNGGGSGDDDDIFDDAGPDTSTSDTGTTDTGTADSGPTCSEVIYPDGGTQNLSLGTADCTTCTEASCCADLAACFQDPTGDCQDLEFNCLQPCLEADPNDAGGCTEDCASLHPDSVNAHDNWSNCQQMNCATQCQ